MEFENKVILQGKMVKKIVINPNTTVITIRVKKSRAEADYPEVYFNRGQCSNKLSKLNVNDYVKVVGTYNTTKKTYPPTEGKKEAIVYRQTISGLSIEKAQTEEEKATGITNSKNRIYKCENQVVLKGRVSSTLMYPNRLSVALYIEGENSNKPNRVAFSVFYNEHDLEALKIFKHNNPVFVLGEVQTMPKKDGSRKKETIVANNYYEISEEHTNEKKYN